MGESSFRAGVQVGQDRGRGGGGVGGVDEVRGVHKPRYYGLGVVWYHRVCQAWSLDLEFKI